MCTLKTRIQEPFSTLLSNRNGWRKANIDEWMIIAVHTITKNNKVSRLHKLAYSINASTFIEGIL